MIVTIRGDSIDISEIPLNHHIEWESLLNDLKGGAHPGKCIKTECVWR
jgi:hypothetical protein